MSNYTPMIQQYLKIKAEHQDSFLFFRLGDFYEMFFEDAHRASRELEITLTSREGGSDERIPMCGIPYHSATNYIKNLITKGFKVAICEQVEDPKASKGVVKREVVQVITPGTIMDGVMLNDKENNYLASFTVCQGGYGLAFSDLSTGDTQVMAVTNFDRVLSELYNRPIKEIVVSEGISDTEINHFKEKLGLTVSIIHLNEGAQDVSHLVSTIKTESLHPVMTLLFAYINQTQKRAVDHLKPAVEIELAQHLGLDMYSKRNLELTETIMKKGKQGSLLWVLDQTATAMGARQLKKWLERPLLDKEALESRYEAVDAFLHDFMNREDLKNTLKSVYDLERLAGRVAFGNVNGRDLIQLKHSLNKMPELKRILKAFNHPMLDQLETDLEPHEDLRTLLENSLLEEPPLSIKEGGLIRNGFNEQLDQYRDASKNGKQWIAELEKKERETTKIKSLKIGYNRVFGYYIEVTKANLHLLPEGKYERKQTLTNAERYITPELKEKEVLILEAEENSVDLEYELFVSLREQVKAYIPTLQVLADRISQIDVLQSFATVADREGYVKPTLTNSHVLKISKGRHPVVEKVMTEGAYVPNDVVLDQEKGMLLITGPNMSGKSTYMRQVALSVIMAQMGSFVPADQATLPIFDQIFTRIGAADDLVSGQSTFMVEMLESRHALVHATQNSLILLDEIGRGTSTYDGMALAQAIIEYVHDNIGAKTLFSTHYHELTTLEESLEHLKNVHVRAEEYDGKVVFLHQIKDGPADESYGIHVAKLAGLPDSLIDRATAILKQLELTEQEKDEVTHNEKTELVHEAAQLSFFHESQATTKQNKTASKPSQLEKTIRNMDLLTMTPIDAINTLYQLKKELLGE